MARSAYPSHWTVKRALHFYLSENGFDIEDYQKSWVWIDVWKLRIPFPNPPSRQRVIGLHDLHHVATGYGTDLPGEAEVSAWEARTGLSGVSPFIQFVVLNGFLSGFLHSPRRTLASFRNVPLADNLLKPNTSYKDYLHLTVGELRAKLGLPEEGLAKERALHSGAPLSKQASV